MSKTQKKKVKQKKKNKQEELIQNSEKIEQTNETVKPLNPLAKDDSVFFKSVNCLNPMLFPQTSTHITIDSPLISSIQALLVRKFGRCEVNQEEVEVIVCEVNGIPTNAL